MQPTGTEYNWRSNTLILFSATGKVISDIKAKVRGTSLKARCTRSTMILGAASFGERALRLVRNMILARLLAPKDFGLMAIVLTASVLLQTLSDVGVRQSIIHNKRGLEEEYLNMAWWFQTVRGLGIYAIAFLTAPLISLFYGKPELTLLLRIACVAVIFNSLISPRTHTMEKELQFGKWVFINYGAGVLGTVFVVALAFWLRNIWALVIGFSAEAISYCLLSFIFCPFWPRLKIDRSSLGELLKYARGMFGLTFLVVVSLNTDVAVLGKVASTEQLGMYALAYALAYQPTALFGLTIDRILLPAFAEIQDDKQILCRYMLKVIRYTFILGIPLIAVAAIFARPILSLVYGSAYAAVRTPFAILCANTLFLIQGLVLSKIYLAIGKPYLNRRFALILTVLIFVLIYPGIVLFGLSGAAGSLLLANAISVCIQVIWMRNIIGLRFQDYLFFLLPFSLGRAKREAL